MDSSFFLVLVAAATGFFMLFRKFRFHQDNKESNSSSLSRPTAATSVSRNWKHDVFPSFHGADVRRTFLSHILESFRRKGIDTFIDNNIERSKSIGPELKEAIKGSKIAIVLLSRKYASSSWCLDELAEIMKCREVLGQIVMTIFYEVDPTDIKKQTGDFGKAFKKTCNGKTKEQVERWRKALEDVATIAGYHSHKWSNEAEMIEKISTDVSNILNLSIPSRDFDGFVGMTPHMEMMEKYLRLDLDEVRMVGIWGPPGIGKTTIATCVFNRFSSRFPFAAIITDIRECYPRLCLDERSAQLKLQAQMLSQIFNQKDIKISHLGVAQERLKDKKVLLVFDEVGHLGQLDALAKETRWFGPGSRIIITTEDLRVLNAHGINHIYKVNFPSSDEAFQIFCMHAFGQNHPHKGLFELAKEVTCLAGELPLGLKVLGSALRGMSKKEWKRILPRLNANLNGEIESVIKFSYDALCQEDKDLFLYLACFFDNQPVHKVEEILANKFLDVGQGLHVLVERSFISIEYGRIKMHTLLRQFGRENSRKQFVHHGVTKRQLLVDTRDIYEVLSDDTIDTRSFIGLDLDFSETEEELNISEKALERMHDCQLIRIYAYGTGVSLERLNSLLYHSKNIRLLYWMEFENICLPSAFNPEFLVELNMIASKLHKLWEGTKQLKNLRWINLQYSKDLKELPDLSTATNLEELRLQGCSSLVELPSSIGKLTSLRILDLSACSSLVELPFSLENATSLVSIPPSIENATNLQSLDLSYCSNLVELPSIGNATKLEILDLGNCWRLVKFPSCINANKLQKFSLRNCSRVVELPTIENAPNLLILDLKNCASLIELPPSIGTAKNLCGLVKLPSSIGDFTNLDTFVLLNCSSLVELPSSIGNLQKLCVLKMCGCSKLETLPININLKSLYILDLTDCSQLKSFPEISTNISELRLKGTTVKEIPLSVTSWSRLSKFEMSYFESLKEFPHALDIITELQLSKDIQEVPPWVKGMSRLRVLRLYDCNNLVSLPQLSDSLSWIDANNCKSLERMDCCFNNPEIRLQFANCFKLNQEARDLIMHTSTSRYAMLPGSKIPACFNHRATAGFLFPIKLNVSPLPTSLRFKACIRLVTRANKICESSTLVWIYVKDKQNDLKVECTPSVHVVNIYLTEHIYTFEVEVEEVTSMELVFEFQTSNCKWYIRECGLLQIMEVPSYS